MGGSHCLELFSTAPQSSATTDDDYMAQVAEVARWSEESGCRGILVYSDNSLVDPWLVSQIIVENTAALCPLVAVQPVYMHPYIVAKMVSSFGYLHGRRLYLNMVAGGFRNDLLELNDPTPHDKRYDRLVEYTLIIKQLLASSLPVTYAGEFYKIDKLRMAPTLRPNLLPGIFLSGSSPAGLQAAQKLAATAIQYPKPAGDLPPARDAGIRIGIIARSDEGEAWQVADQRFPEDHKGELMHKLAMSVSDSVWHKQLSQSAEEAKSRRSIYWLRPFETYKTFCPYLVGSYQQVAEELSRYADLGYGTVILDIPPSREELQHIRRVVDLVTERVSA